MWEIFTFGNLFSNGWLDRVGVSIDRFEKLIVWSQARFVNVLGKVFRSTSNYDCISL